MSTKLQGVVIALVGPDGRHIAHATCFERGAPAGFNMREAQESRARRALGGEVMHALASPLLADAISHYHAEQIVSAMCERGCKTVMIPVGHDE